MINSAIDTGHLGRFLDSKHNVSHLAFADDLMVFTDSNPTSAFTLRYLFLDFSNWSGLHLNTSKSQLFLGVAPANTSFSQIIDIEHAPLPTKYLGLPLKA
ncbi:hypothetical protein QJS10_CPA07g00489 [Acorus calamus]|uniref:Reverse transcriptase domain-containing protein n=1 Tax=Acorus calamus TaxID=4465 RepID=A0AAV9EDR5_ACOCL|nr:hypothetical protein QJS10_CPA07g00489 [Acorus calamus]